MSLRKNQKACPAKLFQRSGGFTLLEILLVVGIIAILAGIVIIAINPGRQLATVRNLQRKTDIGEINKAMQEYYIDNSRYPTSTPDVITGLEQICDTGSLPYPADSADCGDSLVNLSALVPTYVVAIPTDPSGASISEVSFLNKIIPTAYATTPQGTGYWIMKDATNKIVLTAPQAELGTIIALGTTTATTTSGGDTPVTCTDFTYSDWSACSAGTQTETVVTSSPDGCTGGSPVLSQSCSMIPTEGLTNYWSFDDAGSGTALDSVGGVNGTIHGTTAASDIKGVADKAYSFDGSNDYISMADPVVGVTQTLSFWFYTTTAHSDNRTLFFQWYRYIMLQNGVLNYSGDAGEFSLGSPSLNNWHHLVLTSNGSTAAAYLDGSFISSHAAALGIIPIDPYDEMDFGNYLQSMFYYHGSIDQVRIYNRALTLDEVTAIYNAEKP